MEQIPFWTFFKTILFPKTFFSTLGLFGAAMSAIFLSLLIVLAHLIVIYWRKGRKAARQKLSDVMWESISALFVFSAVFVAGLVYAAYPIYLAQNDRISELENVSNHIRFIQQPISSIDPKAPHALKVIVQTDTEISPFSIAIICNGRIEHFNFNFISVGMMMASNGIGGPQHNAAIAKVQTPSFKPETPLIMTIFSKDKIKVIGIQTE